MSSAFSTQSRFSLMALVRRTRTQAPPDPERSALEACAHEGAQVDLRTIELDGQRYGALYRDGELICLLPAAQT